MNTGVVPGKGSDRHYPSIDGLRFLLAFWVAVSHFNVFPLFAGADTSHRALWLLAHGWSTLFYGLPAVIVFFVISGFCIHLPFHSVQEFPVAKYYARRYVRILVPVFAAVLIYWGVGEKIRFWGQHSILWQSVLWSLLCEEIYYFVYPFLFHLRKRVSWRFILVPAIVSSVALAATQPGAESFNQLGPLKTALILYPVWLLGCVLAEQVQQLPVAPSALAIWKWRLLAWTGCWVVCLLHFHSPIHAMQTCMWFGVVAYFWVRQELAYGKVKSMPRWLVWAGAWSYSLYLMHGPARDLLIRVGLPSLGPLLDWTLMMAFICLFSYVFYLFVERPSHRLARRINPVSQREAKTKMNGDLLGEPGSASPSSVI